MVLCQRQPFMLLLLKRNIYILSPHKLECIIELITVIVSWLLKESKYPFSLVPRLCNSQRKCGMAW